MKTLFVGQNSIHLKATDSTNTYASELLRQIAVVDGSVIYTFNQENGRGQKGNAWESQPNKNVALSIILMPTFLSVQQQFLLTKIVSLAVADLMAELLADSSEIKIKWPNDIYINDRKIAGILIENTLRSQNIQYSIVGIGINVNQTEFVGAFKATSLKLIEKKEFDLVSVMELLCEFIEARYLQLKTNKLEWINNSYLQRLFRLNEWSHFNWNDQILEGRIVGVSSIGKLQIELKNNEIKEFDLKEIRFVI